MQTIQVSDVIFLTCNLSLCPYLITDFFFLFLGLPLGVNETTGGIRTTGKLDRETNTNFTFVIIVRIKANFCIQEALSRKRSNLLILHLDGDHLRKIRRKI